MKRGVRMAMSYSQNLKELKQLCEYLWDADFEVDGKTVSILLGF